jgi:hypothetical protein
MDNEETDDYTLCNEGMNESDQTHILTGFFLS